MSNYTIALQELSPQSAVALRAMLNVLQPMLGTRWNLRNELPADVVILPAPALAAKKLKKLNLRDVELPLYFALANDEFEVDGAFALLRRPVTMGPMLQALQRAQELITKQRQRSEGLHTVPLLESVNSQHQLAPSTFDARVRTAMRATTWRLLQTPVPATVLDEGRRSLFSLIPVLGFTTRLTLNDLAAAFRVNPPTVLVELNPAEEAALSQARDFRRIAELEWTFWISNRNPWLRPDVNPLQRYRLSRWPDFGRLPHYKADVRMASLLTTEALSLDELRVRAETRQETAMNFLNGTKALGILRESGGSAPRAAAALQTPARPSGLGGFIAELRRKLNMSRYDNHDH